MITETAQLLSTAHHVLDGPKPGLYKKTHTNHPCAVWVRTSSANYQWTRWLLRALLHEYTRRYHKIHKTALKYPLLRRCPNNIPPGPMTPPAQVMPDHCCRPNVVSAYRQLYRTEKRHLLKYHYRKPPPWL